MSGQPAEGLGTEGSSKNAKVSRNLDEELLVSPRLTRPQVSPRVVSPSYATALGRALSTYREHEEAEGAEPASGPGNAPPTSKAVAPAKPTYSTSAATVAKPPAEVIHAERVPAAYAVSPIKARRSSGEGPITPRTRSPTIGEALAKAMSDISEDGHVLVESRPAAPRVQRGPQVDPIRPSVPGARVSSPSRVVNADGTPRRYVTPRTRSPTLGESLGAALSTFKEPAPTTSAVTGAASPAAQPVAVKQQPVEHQEEVLSSPRSHLIVRAQPIYPSQSTRAQVHVQSQPSGPRGGAPPSTKRTTPPPAQPPDLIPKFQRYVRPKVLKVEQPAPAAAPAAPQGATTAAARVNERPRPRPQPAVAAHYPKKAVVPPPVRLVEPQAHAAERGRNPPPPLRKTPPPAASIPVHKDVNGWGTEGEHPQSHKQPHAAPVEAKPAERIRTPPPTQLPVPAVPQEEVADAVAEAEEPVQPVERKSPVPQAQPTAAVAADTPEGATDERANARSPRTRYAVRTVKPSFASALGRVVAKEEPLQEPVVLTPAETQSPTSPPPSVASAYQSLIWHKDKAENPVEPLAHRRTPTPPPEPTPSVKTAEVPPAPQQEVTVEPAPHPTRSYTNELSSARSTPPPPPPPTTTAPAVPAAPASAYKLPVPVPVPRPVEAVVVHHAPHKTPTTIGVKQPMVLSKGAYVIRRSGNNSNNSNSNGNGNGNGNTISTTTEAVLAVKPTSAPAKAPTKVLAQTPAAAPAEAPPVAEKVPLAVPATAKTNGDEVPYEKRYMKFLRADWASRSKNATAEPPREPNSHAEKEVATPASRIQVIGIRQPEGGAESEPPARAPRSQIRAEALTAVATPGDEAHTAAARTSESVLPSQQMTAANWRDVKCGAPRGNREDPSRRFRGRKPHDHDDAGAWQGCQPGAWDGRPRYRGSQGHRAKSSSVGKTAAE